MDTHTGRESDLFMFFFFLSAYTVIYVKAMHLFLIDNILKLLQLPDELKMMKSHSFSTRMSHLCLKLVCLVTFDLNVCRNTQMQHASTMTPLLINPQF